MAQAKNINQAILGVLESIDSKLDAQDKTLKDQEKQSSALNTNLKGMAATGVVSVAATVPPFLEYFSMYFSYFLYTFFPVVLLKFTVLFVSGLYISSYS